jgi:hypothetical protein
MLFIVETPVTLRCMLMIALAAAAATAQPQPLRTFTDWTVGCDNGGACTAMALQPVDWDGDPDTWLNLTLKRSGGRDAPVRISWDNDLSTRMTLLVDGRTIASGVTSDMSLTDAAVQALRQGRQVSMRAANGATISASLAGLSATLLAMDAAQGRVGTTSALVRPGRRPMMAVAPALPVITRPAAPARPPRTIDPASAAAIIGPDYAQCDDTAPPIEPVAHRLDNGHSMVMIHHPCGNGGYNYFSTVMIVDEQGRATAAPFEVDPGFGGEEGQPPGNMVVNVSYDEASRTLTSYVKGRGIGDCGSISDFVWDGHRFALSAQLLMSECRGRVDYIPVWSAIVR